MIIGIDFGTCFSSVAFMNGLIPVTDYIKDPNKTGIPSLFMYSKAQQKELFGYDCTTAEAVVNSSDVVKYMKRTVRENPENLAMQITSGGKKFTLHKIVEKYLTYLIGEAKEAAVKSGEFTNTNIEAVTITAPVGISEGQMTATDYNKLLVDTIVKITKLEKDKVNVLQEPVSAAISYLYSEDIKKKYDKKQKILVFDLGGGTLDVTIVEHNPKTMEYNIKAKEGDLNLGGNNWDKKLGDFVLKKMEITEPFSSKEEKAKFQTTITRLKHDLTDAEEGVAVFKHNGETKFCEGIKRADFEEATKGLLDKAINVTKKAIADFNSEKGISAIDKIILVGGSCNMPQIMRRMKEEFPSLKDDRIITHDPSKAIAKGAAVYAKMDMRKSSSCLSDHVIKVNDIVTHTYGVNVTRVSDNKEMIYNLLYKGTEFPEQGKIVVKSATDFIPLDDDQKRIEWIVYESDCPKSEGEDANWMDFGSNENKNGMQVTVQIPQEFLGKARSYSCYISFSLDTSGILELEITDKDGNKIGYDKKQI